jgi:hypothetical protein
MQRMKTKWPGLRHAQGSDPLWRGGAHSRSRRTAPGDTARPSPPTGVPNTGVMSPGEVGIPRNQWLILGTRANPRCITTFQSVPPNDFFCIIQGVGAPVAQLPAPGLASPPRSRRPPQISTGSPGGPPPGLLDL